MNTQNRVQTIEKEKLSTNFEQIIVFAWQILHHQILTKLHKNGKMLFMSEKVLRINTEAAYTFGNNTPFEMDRIHLQSGQPDTDKLILERPVIDEERYQQALEDINRTWGVVTDPKSGKTFEIAMANLSAPLDNGIDAELTTVTSSISGNPGNAVEFAENAALHPDRQRIYIAGLGNGRSSYWDIKERKHIRKTGRFTQDNGEALPTLEALNRALKASDFIISRLSTVSAGGAHATALMSALPEGQVTHAYLKSRPNISNHPIGLSWGLGFVANHIIDDKKSDKASRDPWKMTPKMVEAAKEHMPNIYSETAQNQHQTLVQKAGSSHKVSKMLTDLTAFSRGGRAKDYPAVRDTIRALKHQPEAMLTYHFPLQDRLYKHEKDIAEFLVKIYELGKTATNGQAEVLTLPGTHLDHTRYPGLKWAIESYAFDRKPPK